MEELKILINATEFDLIYGFLQPHPKLRLFLSELKEKTLALEEPKPVRRRRSTTKKEKSETENV